MVTVLDTMAQAEKLKGTNKGGNDSGLMLQTNQNAPATKNFDDNTHTAINILLLVKINGIANITDNPQNATKPHFVPSLFVYTSSCKVTNAFRDS